MSIKLIYALFLTGSMFGLGMNIVNFIWLLAIGGSSYILALCLFAILLGIYSSTSFVAGLIVSVISENNCEEL